MEDAHVQGILTLFPHLKALCFRVPGVLTMQALFSVANHCRELAECHLSGTSDIIRLSQHEPRLFPYLRKLYLETIGVNAIGETVSALLHHYAP